MFRLIKSIRKYWTPSILTVFFMVIEAAAETMIPYITANLVNNLRTGNVDMPYLLRVGALLCAIAIISLSCGGLGGFTASMASTGFAKNIRADLMRKIQTFTFHNIDKFSTASLVTRMTTDVSNVQMAYMMIIRIAIRAPLMLAFSIFMAVFMGGRLALAFVIVVPVLMLGLILIAVNAMPSFKRVFKRYDALNESVEENVRGMRVVKGFSREEYEKEKFFNASDSIRKEFTRAEKIVALNGPLMQFCMNFNMIFVLYIGSKLAISSHGAVVDVGQVSAMLTYGVQVLLNLMMLSMIFVMVTMSAESARRIGEVYAEVPDMKEIPNPVKEVKDGSVMFTDVNFKYSEEAKQYALFDIDLTIPSGATVGILGSTGSSKSSLVQLIPRLYDVQEGTVKVGGVNVKDYDLEVLRDNVAMVLQKNVLFSGTIRENLRWGNPDATDEEIVEACKMACADEFIENMPQKYDTFIEQGGSNVSGGQKQRLCIARALLKKPKILILDDSTSAVDTKTDAKIREAFANYIPDTTKIIIAQRVASVESADMIIVMNNGSIEAKGTHEELMESSEIYREIYESQTMGGEE
ncbi:MAG: ABC transporter ATP-binding protein/permease [Lachnospiraceae bacterium]|nr:ABC transporter ATP-binding protein/permease [Lachnospiraceae bacterium]